MMADHGLALPTEERHGLIWVVLTAGAALDVVSHLVPLDAELSAWGLEGSEYLTEREIVADVNRKATIEAFAENYHFPYVHSNSIVPSEEPGRSTLRHGWMASTPAPDDATRAGYAELYEAVHAAVGDEDFGVQPGCGQAARNAASTTTWSSSATMSAPSTWSRPFTRAPPPAVGGCRAPGAARGPR